MAKKKAGSQLPMFTAGEELPIFTQSAYGPGVAPFVEREEGKQGRLFVNDWSELAQAAQDKKEKKGRK